MLRAIGIGALVAAFACAIGCLWIAHWTTAKLSAPIEGGFCIVARDSDLAHRPGKEAAVRSMLARAADAGSNRVPTPVPTLSWHLRQMAIAGPGLMFTSTAERVAIYDRLPRCRNR